MISNVDEIDVRMLNLLRENSRLSIVDLANRLEISRITATRVFKKLTEKKIITSFTVESDLSSGPFAVVHLKKLDKIDENDCLEIIEMFDGTFQIVVALEDLVKITGESIKNIMVAKALRRNPLYRVKNILHCDLCNAKISGTPIIVKHNDKLYYACCPNCERDLATLQSQ